MNFTDHGKALANSEAPYVPSGIGGATEHARACGYDTGTTIILTGKDRYGKNFRMTAHSVFGAYMKAQAAWGIQRGWHEDKDGKRRLVFQR